MELDQEFWNKRWEAQQTGWDIGIASPALVTYLEKLENKSISILIPGCGNAHEAEWLLKNGFEDITLIDIAPSLVMQLRDKFKAFPQIKVILGDFFELKGSFDLMLEQTFFCAIDPSLRYNYVSQVSNLLKPGGKLIGLLFNIHFEREGPPFGGSEEVYLQLFSKFFQVNKMEKCYNSIKPRANTELFVELTRLPDSI